MLIHSRRLLLELTLFVNSWCSVNGQSAMLRGQLVEFTSAAVRLRGNLMDPISATANAVTIADRAAAAIRWVRRQTSRSPRAAIGRPGFELKPVTFELDLSRPQPRVELCFYAVNYRRRALELHQVKITQLNVSGGPVIEHVDLLHEVKVSPRGSCSVYCGAWSY
jgi:hypothetical protein